MFTKIRNKLNYILAFCRKFFIFAGILIVLLFDSSCESLSEFSSEKPPPEAAELKAICDNLPIIPDSKKVRDDEIIASNVVNYTTVYESALDKEKIKSLYLNSLTAKGWQFSDKTKWGTTHWIFRKDKFSILVENITISFFSTSKEYYVTCSWRIE